MSVDSKLVYAAETVYILPLDYMKGSRQIKIANLEAPSSLNSVDCS